MLLIISRHGPSGGIRVSDAAENEPGQSRLTRGESERGPGDAGAGVVGSERVMEVWECLLGPLTFVVEASYNPVLKDHTDIMESPWMELNGDH